jgi:5'-3' exonuclease
MSESSMSSVIDRLKDIFAVTQPSKINKIMFIDGMNMFMRSFHMINHLDADGDHVGGLAGFLKSLGAMIKYHTPTEVYVVFDGEAASSTKRNLYRPYKANRELTKISKPLLYSSKADERAAIYNQAVRAAGYCKLLPVKTVSIDNMEADDVIGAMVNKLMSDDTVDEITLITEDSDYLQLINDKVQLYFPIKKQFASYKYVLERYNCHPNNFGLYKSLIGDTSDNIPGVKGLGDKTIARLFPYLRDETKYSLKDIYDTCQENQDSSISMYGKILAYKTQLDINYQLVDLHGIEFLDSDHKIMDDTISGIPSKFEPEMFMRLYNADGLMNSILNVRAWLFECFNPLIKKI